MKNIIIFIIIGIMHLYDFFRMSSRLYATVLMEIVSKGAANLFFRRSSRLDAIAFFICLNF
jgi:hypothetical protein